MADEGHQFFAFPAAEEILQHVELDLGMIEAAQVFGSRPDQRRCLHHAFGESIAGGAYGIQPRGDRIVREPGLAQRVHQLEQVASQLHVVA